MRSEQQRLSLEARLARRFRTVLMHAMMHRVERVVDHPRCSRYFRTWFEIDRLQKTDAAWRLKHSAFALGVHLVEARQITRHHGHVLFERENCNTVAEL